MVIEILLLNSIRRPFVSTQHRSRDRADPAQAVGSHLMGLVFLSGMYLGWAAMGNLLTGWYPFFWLDKEQVGSEEAVTAYCMGFVILAPLSESASGGQVARLILVLQCTSSCKVSSAPAKPSPGRSPTHAARQLLPPPKTRLTRRIIDGWTEA